MKHNFFVGDKIAFKPVSGKRQRKETRVIKGFNALGFPIVSYGGQDEFVLFETEIIGLA